MAQINVSDLTFHYDGSYDDIFTHVSFVLDTSWKLVFIGRNGKGKTTFLNLLLGNYSYSGSIDTTTTFDYFPYQISQEQMQLPATEFMEIPNMAVKPGGYYVNSEHLERDVVKAYLASKRALFWYIMTVSYWMPAPTIAWY